jgi:hypothetical protein
MAKGRSTSGNGKASAKSSSKSSSSSSSKPKKMGVSRVSYEWGVDWLRDSDEWARRCMCDGASFTGAAEASETSAT